ncbi:MAG: S-methyl-5-thioribose kinase, partial [Pseudomonadota bacterium]
FPGLGSSIGTFLGETLFKTSTLGMESIARRRLMQDFNLNDELCKLTEEFIFTFPYVDHPSNYKNPPTNAHALDVFRNDPEYLNRILHFKELFMTKSDALLHGDLHTGSLMVGQNETYVIDVEFAFFGPFGFDIGKIIANFLMAYTSHFHRPGGPDYQAWLLSEAVTIWKAFEAEFMRLWDTTSGAALYFEGMLEPADLAEYKTRFMQKIFDDAMGFCACSVARRTVGLAGVADVRAIEDPDVRTRLECMNVDLSHWIMMQYDEIGDIDRFEAIVKEFYAKQAPLNREGTTCLTG